MLYLNGKYYVEVKDKRYSIHPLFETILRETEEPKNFRTLYHVRSKTQIGKNRKVKINHNDQLELKRYLKNKCKIVEKT